MQNLNEGHTHTAAARARAAQPEKNSVGVRGCWELLIKLIILLVLIFILFTWFLGRADNIVGRSPYTWLILLLLILLLLWLIWLQKHFVSLSCDLTAPDGCVVGHTDILSGRALEPILGTAMGVGFVRYELELIYMGPGGEVVVPDGILYAVGGLPDTTPPFGNTQVNTGTLGYIDLRKAGDAVGLGVHNAEFKVRLRVFGLGGTTHGPCENTFKVVSVSAYIKNVGGAVAPDPKLDAEQLHTSDDATSALATIGGSFAVRGAADVFGCDKKIAEYHIWVIPGFGFAQPGDGTAVVPGGDWIEVATVVYRDANASVWDARVSWNRLKPPSSALTMGGWTTRPEPFIFDSSGIFFVDVPSLFGTGFDSLQGGSADLNGKFTFLLQVIDQDNRTFYDIQQVWIDNKVFQGKVTSLRYHLETTDIAACTDILINNGSGQARKLDVRGYATDPLIIAGDTTIPTSDNFGSYSVTFRKQGAADEFTIDASTLPVPDRATWSGAPGDPPVPLPDILATLDLSWLDAGNPSPVDADGNLITIPDDQRLPRRESCTYNIILRGGDRTLVNENTNHTLPGGIYLFPVKIVNDLPALP
jgi:hypothetical protein